MFLDEKQKKNVLSKGRGVGYQIHVTETITTGDTTTSMFSEKLSPLPLI